RAIVISARHRVKLIFLKAGNGMDGGIDPPHQLEITHGQRVSLAQQEVLGYLRQNRLPHLQTPIQALVGLLLHLRVNLQWQKSQSSLNREGQLRSQKNQRDGQHDAEGREYRQQFRSMQTFKIKLQCEHDGIIYDHPPKTAEKHIQQCERKKHPTP